MHASLPRAGASVPRRARHRRRERLRPADRPGGRARGSAAGARGIRSKRRGAARTGRRGARGRHRARALPVPAGIGRRDHREPDHRAHQGGVLDPSPGQRDAARRRSPADRRAEPRLAPQPDPAADRAPADLDPEPPRPRAGIHEGGRRRAARGGVPPRLPPAGVSRRQLLSVPAVRGEAARPRAADDGVGDLPRLREGSPLRSRVPRLPVREQLETNFYLGS